MKNKIIKILLIAFLFSPVIYAQKNRTYTDKKNSFSIAYPKSWNRTSQSKKSSVKFVVAKSQDGYVPASAIMIIAKANNSPQDSIFYHYAKNLRLRGDKFIDSGKSIINNQKYYWFTTLIDNSLENIKSLYYMTFKNNKVIIIQFSANKADKFPEYEATFLEIITSLTLL